MNTRRMGAVALALVAGVGVTMNAAGIASASGRAMQLAATSLHSEGGAAFNKAQLSAAIAAEDCGCQCASSTKSATSTAADRWGSSSSSSTPSDTTGKSSEVAATASHNGKRGAAKPRFNKDNFFWGADTLQTKHSCSAKCSVKGAQLPVVYSDSENSWLTSEFTAEKGQIWLDFDDLSEADEFTWSSGASSTYTNWAENEPNSAGNGDDCTILYTSGEWNDEDCSDTEGYCLCETLASPTQAPTSAEYWVVYFTDGEADESYVWYAESDYEGIQMQVLLDTTGDASGIVANVNNTVIYFADTEGSIYSVGLDGYDLTELATLGKVRSHGLGGMDLDHSNENLYVADTSAGSIYKVSKYGGDLTEIISDAGSPHDVKIDVGDSKIYVSNGDSEKIDVYGFHSQTYDYSIDCGAKVYGLSVDVNDKLLYAMARSDLYSVNVETEDVTVVYSGLSSGRDVAVDYAQSLLFYADATGIYKGYTDGETAATLVSSYLRDVNYIYAAAETAPSAYPTQVPTVVPTSVPTSSPTSLPIPTPTATPSSLPIPAPTSLPKPEPTPMPTPVPSQRPSQIPVPDPTPMPTPVPSQRPSQIPVPEPTPMPTPVPSQVPSELPNPSPSYHPTPTPSKLPQPAPSPMPTPLPSLYPTSPYDMISYTPPPTLACCRIYMENQCKTGAELAEYQEEYCGSSVPSVKPTTNSPTNPPPPSLEPTAGGDDDDGSSHFGR